MKPTLFIIEDDPDFIEAYIDLFEKSGNRYLCRCFEDPEEALSLLQVEKTSPSAILIDINMPKINGIKFLEIIRIREITSPVIIVSAIINREHAIKALNLGAYAIIEKKDIATLLVRTTNRAVSHHQSIATAENLISAQWELIRNLEHLKNVYEDRIVLVENMLIDEFKKSGKMDIDGTKIKKFGHDLDKVIEQSKSVLEDISKNFSSEKLWR